MPDRARKPHPWEQQPDESNPAYAAFCIYRDMQAPRSVVGAYRLHQDDPDLTDASARWKVWSAEQRWSERSRAYDARLQAAKLRGVERAGARWADRNEAAAERFHKIGTELLARVETLIAMPATERTVSDDGKTVTIHPVKPQQLKVVADLAKDALLLLNAAVEKGMGIAREKEKAGVPAEHGEAVKERAASELDLWRAEQRARMLAQPTAPPAN